MENQPLLDLAWRACFRWRLRPRQVTGDTAYGTLEILTAFEQAGIHAYMPLPNWEDQYAVWSASHFQYEPEADQYRCPQGTILQRIGELDRATGRQLYRAPASVCNACPVKAHCTTSDQGRRLSRHVGEEYRERVQAYQQTPAYEKALRKRQVWVEPLFAEGKQWHGMRRFRLRRLWRVNCEALLIATGQNLKRLLQKRGWGRRPFPNGAAMAADGFYASLYINFLGDHPRGRRGSATLRRAQPRPSAQRTAGDSSRTAFGGHFSTCWRVSRTPHPAPLDRVFSDRQCVRKVVQESSSDA
jgi:Transposase DDE domain